MADSGKMNSRIVLTVFIVFMLVVPYFVLARGNWKCPFDPRCGKRQVGKYEIIPKFSLNVHRSLNHQSSHFSCLLNEKYNFAIMFCLRTRRTINKNKVMCSECPKLTTCGIAVKTHKEFGKFN